MKRKIVIIDFLFIIIFLIIVLFIFRNWLTNSLITSGDFWPLFKPQYDNYHFFPSLIDPLAFNGFGSSDLFSLWGYAFLKYPVYLFGTLLQLPYIFVERLGYLFPLIVMVLFSSFIWSRAFFANNLLLRLICGLIFTTNTYIIMVVTGGQLSIAFSYLLAPFTFLSFIKLISICLGIKGGILLQHKNKLFLIFLCLTGLLLSAQVAVDIRMAYVTFLGSMLYLLFTILSIFLNNKNVSFAWKKTFLLIFSYMEVLIIFSLVHAYWLLPLIILKENSTLTQLGQNIISVGAVKFFSFATFENSIGLLQPNWPENIFGKVNFMRPEFLILPLIAFSSLFFIKKNKTILFFAILALIGVFLSKGANGPYGNIYIWVFQYIPGFIMFRDSTKWYLFIALSYSVLIPIAIYYASSTVRQFFITKGKKSLLFMIVSVSFIMFWFFIIFPLFSGEVKGILTQAKIPSEYVRLKNRLVEDKRFSRVLWVPQMQRFGYYSPQHPFVNATQFFGISDTNQIADMFDVKTLQTFNIKNLLIQSGIKYIIIPQDSEHELFLDNRMYSQKVHDKIENSFDKVKYLEKEKDFKNIAVYTLSDTHDLFWIENKDTLQNNLSYERISPTKFIFNLKQGQYPLNVIFSQAYDKNWVAIQKDRRISPKQYIGKFNSFTLLSKGRYVVEFKPQQYVIYGFFISIIAVASLLLIITFGIIYNVYENYKI